MPNECAVCKQPAVVAARITRGEQSVVVNLCEKCALQVGKRMPTEIVDSRIQSLPKGIVLSPSTHTMKQETPAPQGSFKINDSNDLITYIEQVKNLECSVYQQEEVIRTAKRNSAFKDPVVKTFRQPKKSDIKMPIAPKPPEKELVIYRFLGIALFLTSIGIAFFIGSLPWLGFFAIMFSIIFWYVFFMPISKNNSNKDEYESKMNEYNREMEKYKKKCENEERLYKQKMDEYTQRVSEAQAKYELEREVAITNSKIAKDAIDELSKPVQESKALLAELYSYDVVFPKYRNMIAICSIFEYLASGRVTTLDGPNGAYNLFEMESRQNIIINKLDAIIDQLEKIKQNQYVLYSEMQKTNDILQKISNEVNHVAHTTQRIETQAQFIAKATYLTAYYSEITAQNTEAIKYINMIRNS